MAAFTVLVKLIGLGIKPSDAPYMAMLIKMFIPMTLQGFCFFHVGDLINSKLGLLEFEKAKQDDEESQTTAKGGKEAN